MNFEIRINPKALISAASELDGFAGSVSETALAVVNRETRRFEQVLQKGMGENIALDPGYIRSQMTFDPATSARSIRARITTRGSLVVLGHYSPKTIYVPATSRRKSFKGDAKRGIPAGQKNAGVQVTVKPSAPRAIPGAFTMTLRRGTQAGDSVGVFTRSPAGGLVHRYGIAPYSLFKYQVAKGQDAFADSLSLSIIDEITGNWDHRKQYG
jgi:hypothetical protein